MVISTRKGTFQLLIIMILVSLIATGISLLIIYNVVLNEKRDYLKELSENQIGIIRSVYKATKDGQKVLTILKEQQRINPGLGTTGEFSIGYLKNDTVFFILSHRHLDFTNAKPIPLKSKLGVPIKYALSKKNGFIEGLDYRNVQVLAYCAYIPELKWGLAAKLDLTEVRAPFYRAGQYAIMSALILVFIGTFIFRKVSDPIVKRIIASEDRYRNLFEYSAVPIWEEDFSQVKQYLDQLKSVGITDFRTYFKTHKDEINELVALVKVVDVNQKSVTFFDVDSKAEVITNLLFYFNEISLDIFKDEIITLAEGKNHFECEMPIRTLKGGIQSLLLHLSVMPGYEQTLKKVLVTFIDITESKQKEKELHKLNHTLKALGKSSQSMLRAKNEAEYLEEVCKIVAEDCGYAMVWIGFAEEDEGKTITPVAYAGFEKRYLETLNITWADTERGQGPTGMAIRTGKVCSCRNMLTDPKFKPWREEAIKRGYASSVVLPLLAYGKAFGAINIYSKEPDSFSDDEVNLLSELANDLAYGITTIRLHLAQTKAEEQLRQYASELKDLNATKDKFFGIIAHDLRNPFSSLLGASEILVNNAHQYDANNIIQFSTLMNDAAKRGYALLENLLEWSRSQTGNLKYNPKNVNIKDVVAECLSNTAVNANNKNIKLYSEINRDIQAVADENMLNTILRNLLSNAIKFTHQGGEVSVSAKVNDNDIILAVRDTGIGIPEDDTDKLFRIDTHYTNIGTAEERGTGLGLLLCKEFVEKHGGKIWVESIVGKGSEFKFTIPLKK